MSSPASDHGLGECPPPDVNEIDIERRIVRKLDLILLPFLSVLFLLNSLDRSNIGNAETAHFTRDAGLAPEDFNVAVAFFFAFFVALQPVGAAAGRKFGMATWVPSVMVLWGLLTICHIFVTKKWQLVTIRILLGALEAGFYPTTVSYMSLFYTRYEFARRLALFYGQYAVAGALGGILAFLVFSYFPDREEVPARGGWKSWQVLFLVEGFFTIIVAAIGFLWLPKTAGTAWFLNPTERQWAEKRVRMDRERSLLMEYTSTSETDFAPSEFETQAGSILPSSEDEQRHHLLSPVESAMDEGPSTKHDLTADRGLSKSDMLSTVLFLPMALPILIINIASAIPSTAFSIFLPLVLESLKLSSPLYSNLLTAPPFIFAAITLYRFTHWSDRSQQRIRPIVTALALIGTGLLLTIVLLEAPSHYAAIPQYLSLCIVLSGSFIPSPLTVAWLSGNIPEPGKRAIVLGINGWGNLAGILAALLFAPRWRANGYRIPLWITLFSTLLSGFGFLALALRLHRLNTAKAKAAAQKSQTQPNPDPDENVEEVAQIGSVYGSASIGGKLWDSAIRYWVGQRLFKMSRQEAFTKRGDEQISFRYSL